MGGEQAFASRWFSPIMRCPGSFAVQRQTAITSYFLSKQLLTSGFAGQLIAPISHVVQLINSMVTVDVIVLKGS